VAGTSNLGLTLGVTGLAAAFLLLCCKRKRKDTRYLTEMLKGHDRGSVRFEGNLALAETVTFEADKVFDWLDEDGDGYITHVELSDSLNITKAEAKTIIEETQLTLHGSPEASPSLAEGKFHISRDDFHMVMKAGAKNDELPAATEARYRQVFDSIDMDGKGFITMDDLAAATGADEDEMAEMPFGTDGKITYDDFVQLLRQSEVGRAAKTLLDLLNDIDRGHELAAAVAAMEAQARLDKESALPPVATPHEPVRAHHTPLDASPRIGAGLAGMSSSGPEVLREDMDDLWDSIEDPSTGDVDMDELQCALMAAQSVGTLPLTDDQVVEVVFELNEKATTGGDGQISSEDFWAVMNKYTIPEHDHEGKDAPFYRTGTVDSLIGNLEMNKLPSDDNGPGIVRAANEDAGLDSMPLADPNRKSMQRAPSGISVCSTDSLPNPFLKADLSRVPMPVARQASDMDPPKGDTPDGFATPTAPRSRVNHMSLHTSPYDPSLRRGDSAQKGGSSLMHSAYLDRGMSAMSDLSMLSSDDESDSETEGPMQNSGRHVAPDE